MERIDKPLFNMPNSDIQGLPFKETIRNLRLLKYRTELETAYLKRRLLMNQFRPSYAYPVTVYNDGLRWVCSYINPVEFEDNEIEAEAFGRHPEEAMRNFDAMWLGIDTKEGTDSETKEDLDSDKDEDDEFLNGEWEP